MVPPEPPLSRPSRLGRMTASDMLRGQKLPGFAMSVRRFR